ncbi:MAG: T9SS type A sorting domain-containing protein [Bacteroidota bacterium]|nr:DUF4397 domain-containing protein [Candidatus Kapabacteria bacterium]MDW8220574.1 T9SS type A sorting domain-containing protein [Bacteroidota bacterium]
MIRLSCLRVMIALGVGVLSIARIQTIAQVTTSLQLAHLSADPALSPVAVWAGIPAFGTVQFLPAAPSMSFRNATPAISSIPNPLISGVQIPVGLFVDSSLTVHLTPVGSTTATPTIPGGQFTGLRLRRGANIGFIRGVQSPSEFAPNPQRGDIRLILSVLVDTVNVASNAIRIIVYHAVTDAPAIDVVVRETNEVLVSQLAFDQAAPYILPDGNYTLDVYQSSPRRLLASYAAPLRNLGYTGQRIVLAATGFLNPAQNRNGAAFGLLAIPNTESAQPSLLRTTDPPPAGVRLPDVSVQVIHASADPLISPLALWLNTAAFGGSQAAPLATSLAFRTATPIQTFLRSATASIPLQGNTNRPTEAFITAATSGTLPGATLIRVPNYVIASGGNCTLIEGVVDTTRFVRNPSGRSVRFQLRTLPDTATFLERNQTRLLVAHSVTDLGDVTIDVRDATGAMLATLGPLDYGRSFVALTVPTINYTLAVRLSATNMTLGTFALNLASENLGGKRVLITATGFASPAQNLGGPGVRLLAAVNDSTGRAFLLPGGFTSVRERLDLVSSSVGMALHAVMPNPVRDRATIQYELQEAKEVECSLIDAQGTIVWSGERQLMPAGRHTLVLDVRDYAQGAYIVRLADMRGHAVSARISVVR